MPGPEHDSRTKSWAVSTYRESRPNYSSRAECVTVLAKQIRAHANTVNRWTTAEFGPSRALPSETATAKLRAAQAEIDRLRRANRELSDRGTAPMSPAADR